MGLLGGFLGQLFEHFLRQLWDKIHNNGAVSEHIFKKFWDNFEQIWKKIQLRFSSKQDAAETSTVWVRLDPTVSPPWWSFHILIHLLYSVFGLNEWMHACMHAFSLSCVSQFDQSFLKIWWKELASISLCQLTLLQPSTMQPTSLSALNIPPSTRCPSHPSVHHSAPSYYPSIHHLRTPFPLSRQATN